MKCFAKAAEIQAVAPKSSWFSAQNTLIRRFLRQPSLLFQSI
jgi:hypothetical protein